eukprot:4868915-Karenia_brevis.AAC.1
MIGDFNVHEESWLRFSAGTSPEGRELHEITVEYGMQQYVNEPTRESYLLDLVLSDMGDSVTTK